MCMCVSLPSQLCGSVCVYAPVLAVDPEEDPEYWQSVSCPCDLATILAHVDNRHYHTAAAYLAHVALIEKVGVH